MDIHQIIPEKDGGYSIIIYIEDFLEENKYKISALQYDETKFMETDKI